MTTLSVCVCVCVFRYKRKKKQHKLEAVVVTSALDDM